MPGRAINHTESSLPRHIALHGARNFRDIGGYRTADGRRVRWRRIFRSDSLSEITNADIEVIARLGVRTVYDLRSAYERQNAPDRLPTGLALRVSGQPNYHAKVTELSERIRTHIVAGEFDAEVTERWVCERYRLFPTEELGEYRRYIHQLLEQTCFPMVVHCASGKDRTGFAVALTLMALGVTREMILQDYLLSNRYRRSLAAQLPPTVSPQILAALSGVQPGYLLAAFETIDTVCGGDEIFLAQGLGLGTAHLQHLRAILLEPSRG